MTQSKPKKLKLVKRGGKPCFTCSKNAKIEQIEAESEPEKFPGHSLSLVLGDALLPYRGGLACEPLGATTAPALVYEPGLGGS